MINRRDVNFGLRRLLVAFLLAPAVASRALAQLADPIVPADAWQTLAAISADATAIGLPVPKISAAGKGAPSYREFFPVLRDFIDKLDDEAGRSKAPPIEVGKLKKRANDLLRAISRAEHAPVRR